MSYYKIFAIAVLGALLAGCPSTPIEDPTTTEPTYGGADGADTSGMDDDGMGDGEFFDDEFDESLGTVIYFDFDFLAVFVVAFLCGPLEAQYVFTAIFSPVLPHSQAAVGL